MLKVLVLEKNGNYAQIKYKSLRCLNIEIKAVLESILINLSINISYYINVTFRKKYRMEISQ